MTRGAIQPGWLHRLLSEPLVRQAEELIAA